MPRTNEYGQIIDPEIAQKMAGVENTFRGTEQGLTSNIEEVIDDLGNSAQEAKDRELREQQAVEIGKKLRTALTGEEKQLLGDALEERAKWLATIILRNLREEN